MNLIELLTKPEGKTLEFKRDLSSPEKALRSLVAFANTSGGILLIGVENENHRIRGVKEPLELEERLANLISDSIHPRLLPELEILPWRRTHLIAVQVYPSSTRPHYLKSLGLESGVFVRVGSTNRKADRSLIEEFGRYARNQSYDETPMPELNSEAVDFRAASELFQPVRKLQRNDLETLHLLVRYHGRQVPTVGGIVLFGKERERHFPDAWVQLGLFEGKDRTHIIDTAEIRSFPVQAVEEVIAFVKRNISRKAIIGEVHRVDEWGFPLVAIREAVINAFVHADYAQRGAPVRVSIYSDRLEIESPGLLPFGLTVEEIQKGLSKLRNRVIGKVFHTLGLIEQWGSGIQRMTNACREAGIEDPHLEEVGTHFRVTFSRVRHQRPVIDETDQAILKILKKHKTLSTTEVAKKIRKSPRATQMRLQKLVGRGMVVGVGTSSNDPKRRYYLTERIK